MQTKAISQETRFKNISLENNSPHNNDEPNSNPNYFKQ